MRLSHNNCSYITAENENFESYLNNPLIEKMEISVVHNCCENYRKTRESYLGYKIVASDFENNDCVDILEYFLKLAKSKVRVGDVDDVLEKVTWTEAIEDIFKTGILLDSEAFCCPDGNIELTTQCVPSNSSIQLACLVKSDSPVIANFFCEEVEADSNGNLFNLNSDFENEVNRLHTLLNVSQITVGDGYVETISFGGHQDCASIIAYESDILDGSLFKEFGSINGKSILNTFNNFLEQEVESLEDRLEIVRTFFYSQGFAILCTNVCGEHRIFIGSVEDGLGAREGWGDNYATLHKIYNCTLLDEHVDTIDETLLSVSSSFIGTLIGTEFNTNEIETSIQLTNQENPLANPVSIEYLTNNSFRVSFSKPALEPYTISLRINENVLTRKPLPILHINFSETGEYLSQSLQYIFNSSGIIHDSTENSFVLNPEIFYEYMEGIFESGIYSIRIRFIYYDETEIVFSNCIFVDCKLNCILAKYMVDNLGKPEATEMAMIYQALNDASNCMCNCEDSCQLFEYLWSHLSNTQIPQDCGC